MRSRRRGRRRRRWTPSVQCVTRKKRGYICFPTRVPPWSKSQACAGSKQKLREDNLDGCIDVPVKRGDSALHMTCFDGFLPCVQLLLERGANLETRDLNGANPLHNACGGGSAEVVAFLINTAPYLEVFKRILNTTDRDGDTPLHYAVSGGYLEVVQLLVREGASLTAANVRGKVPAVLAQPESEVRRFLDEAAAAVTSASNSH
ncbi:hypothetical protein AMTRI_Chr07g26650 [Amborella trichopoda]